MWGGNYSYNLNQMDPNLSYQFKGLVDQAVANPFFNLLPPSKMPGTLRTQETVAVSQLLKPYPQYGDLNLYGWPGDTDHYYALQMKAERQKIGHDQDFRGAAGGEAVHGSGQVGTATFEKRGLDQLEGALAGDISGDGAHGFIRRFDARSVGEDDESGLHTINDPAAWTAVSGNCPCRKSRNARPRFRPL